MTTTLSKLSGWKMLLSPRVSTHPAVRLTHIGFLDARHVAMQKGKDLEAHPALGSAGNLAQFQMLTV